MNKLLNDPDVMLLRKQKPQPVDFVSMVQHFTRVGEKATMPRDFNLRDFQTGWRLIPFGKDTYGLYNWWQTTHTPYNLETGTLNDDFENESRANFGAPRYIVKFNRQEYEDAKLRWQQYWDWKRNRNAARNELEVKFGYDTKHAMHLVRLLRMGAEALEQGKIFVKRPDAAELLEIRNGKWTYDQIIEYAEKMDKKVREELYETTKLPKKANIHLAAELIIKIQDMTWTPTK